ncbi:hypothetical protein BOTBODRAFT_70790 [Botryobasidium botryosum FD-172 SS1]|uniref:F-box domain-containing protein n=1 Tax=Botryobasidium botryosum (strain FD-172 SS1) TaxID=930990 RepID=A0A067M5J2_BOTB1|nr:hypothetical protein BOTBODRAFT_70790 [Botryobasidium botryosum FD-172 SS1]
MSLPTLNYDIIAAIASKLNAGALLNLALTCRAMRQAIIPELLYARASLSLNDETMHQDFVVSFCRSIMAYGPVVANAVRHLEICIAYLHSRAVADSLREALEKTVCLRGARLCYASPHGHEPWIYNAIASQTQLTHLDLFDPPPDALIVLKNLSGLTSFKFAGHIHTYLLSPNSSLTHLLSNFRHTLEELSLHKVTWFLQPLRRSGPNTADDLVWPALRTLDLDVRIRYGSAFDLAHCFPSTRTVSLRTYPHASAAETRYRYPPHIESFTGRWDEYVDLVDSGSSPQHVRVKEIPTKPAFTSIELASQLPHSLQSLVLAFDEDGVQLPLNLLEHIAECAPNLRSFYMVWTPVLSADSNALCNLIEKMTAPLVRLPLRYLAFHVTAHLSRASQGGDDAGPSSLQMAADGFLRQIEAIGPSLTAACIRVSYPRQGPCVGKYWRAREVPCGELPGQHLVEVPEELGCAGAAIYEP